ncbi:MAG: HAMP domain-containing protein [bacterium]|nr:HAMP domain-containing protein [bacterium]
MNSVQEKSSFIYPALTVALWFLIYFLFSYLAPSVPAIHPKWGYLISAGVCAVTILLIFYSLTRFILKPIWLLLITIVAAGFVYFGNHFRGAEVIRAVTIDLGLILFSITTSSLLIRSLNQKSYLVPIAVLGSALDLWSGVIGPTKSFITTGEINYFLIRFPLLGTAEIPGFFGVSDCIFSALFLFATVKFKFNRTNNFLILTLAFIVVFLIVIFSELAIPALPVLSLGFVLVNWGHLEQSGEPKDFPTSSSFRKRQWIFSVMLIILLVSIPILKWYARTQIKQKIETIDSFAKQSIELSMQKCKFIMENQQAVLKAIARRPPQIIHPTEWQTVLNRYHLQLPPGTQAYLVTKDAPDSQKIICVYPSASTDNKAGNIASSAWKKVFTQMLDSKRIQLQTDSIVIPAQGLQMVTYLQLTTGGLLESAQNLHYLVLFFPITAQWLKKEIQTHFPNEIRPEFALLTRTTDPKAINEWITVDATITEPFNNHELPRFTDRELNLSFLDRGKYFFYQHIGEAPYKICGYAIPFTISDSLLCALLPYPIEVITKIDRYTQISTSAILLFVTLIIVSLVVHRGLKLTKKFVFALALATLLPIVIFRFAGFSTRDALEEQISRHVSDGLLRTLKIVTQLKYELHQLAISMASAKDDTARQAILQNYQQKYPQLHWAQQITSNNNRIHSAGDIALLNFGKPNVSGTLFVDPESQTPMLFDQYTYTQNNLEKTTVIGLPVSQGLLHLLKLNSGTETAFVWENNIISTLPRMKAESLKISETELAEAELTEVESFTVSRQHIGDMVYTVGYLRFPIYTFSTTLQTFVQSANPGLFAIAIPRTFVDQQIKEFDDNLMSFTILMLLIASFIGFGLTVMTMHPLIKLIRGTQEVGAGNLEYQVDIRQKDEMGELGRSFNQMVRLLKDRQRVRDTFSKYVSERVAEKILSHPEGVPLKGERRPITILYADIRGFTALAEKGNPEEVVAMLNECFTHLIDIIFKYEGTLDKFIGDCIMALFGAPIPAEDSLERAILAALAMQEQMDLFNQSRRGLGLPEIKIGIGINYGEAIVGNVGSQRRLEYTAVGDNVNIAFRLQEIADGGQILVTEECFSLVDKKFTGYPIGPITVKGKEKPITVVQITGVVKPD